MKAALLLALALPPGEGQELPPEQERALAVLERALQLAREGGEEIWPEFDVEKIPVAVFAEDSALLIQHPDPPAQYVEFETDRNLTGLCRGPRTQAMQANTSGPLGGSVAAFVSLASLGRGEVETPEVALVVHEIGHAFCARAPKGGARRWPQEDARQVAAYPTTAPANNAWGRIECALLREALEAREETLRADLAADFLAVRLLRQRELSAAFVRYEEEVERNEGLAEYFALRALELAEGTGGSYFLEFLEKLDRACAGGRGAERPRFYSSGAGQGLLLDRLGVAWKPAVEEGRSLQEILQSALGVGDLESRVERIERQHGYAKLLESERLSANAARAVRRAKLLDLLASSPRLLILDLSRAGGVEQVLSFDPMNVVAASAGELLHERMLRVAFEGGEASFERPVLQHTNRHWLITSLPEEAHTELDAEGVGVSGGGVEITRREAGLLGYDRGDLKFVAVRPGEETADLDPAPYVSYLEAARAEAARPRPAAPFEAADLTGATHRHPEVSARPTALVFVSAAAWARPGRRLARELIDGLATADPSRPHARLLLVASQCSLSELEDLLGDWDGRSVMHDEDRTIAQAYGVESYPTTIWIDAEGHVESVQKGYAEDLATRLLERQRAR